MQSRLFESQQKPLFEKTEGKSWQNNVKPNVEESRKFWSNIWFQNVGHSKSAE